MTKRRIPAVRVGGVDVIEVVMAEQPALALVDMKQSGASSAGVADFDEVVATEWSGLVALALGLTGSLAAAEDLVQDALLRLHQHWSQVSGYERPGAWLRRVVLNLATSRARRLAAEAKALARLGRERQADEVRLGGEAADFWATVRTLSRRQAQVLALYYGEDRPVADIADILQCAEGTVRSHLHDGREALQRRLRPADDQEATR